MLRASGSSAIGKLCCVRGLPVRERGTLGRRSRRTGPWAGHSRADPPEAFQLLAESKLRSSELERACPSPGYLGHSGVAI